MKISELVSRLNELSAQHGDIEVRAYAWDSDLEGPVNKVTQYEAHDAGYYPEHIEISHDPDLE